MSRARILYLAHRIPYPPDKGDKIRSWRTVEHLAERFDVDLAAFVDEPADFQHEDHLRRVCASVALVPLDRRAATLRSALGFLTGEPLTLPFYRDARMRRAVMTARAKGPVAEMAFSSSMAPYLDGAAAPSIIDLCDADSAKWAEYAKRKRWPMSGVYAREGRLLERVETAFINRAGAAFAITEEEADLLGSRDGVEKPVHWFANGVDANYFAPDAVAPQGARIDAVFVGAMDYWANVDAVRWFAAEVWPLVRQSIEDATFVVVGSKPDALVLALQGRQGITVTGRVEDVRPYLAAAKIVVAPMRIARGIQNKVLEAMAAGKAVVATPAALEGIDATIGAEAIAAASPDTFARACVRLIEDRASADAIGRAARSRILDDYQWAAQFKRLDAALEALIAGRAFT
ncbi:MAG: TIGR03087 family PEP-CTERM/XrtA system glycosyltransferase [Parvularculaceae bacterium]|nr:TIGR03087 family PEP-CTERM/XrtA system glycosyltransferase [Parvularculaceae bacterium]